MADSGIVFRVDGSRSLGLGHIVRSLNLADAISAESEAINEDVAIRFAIADDPGARHFIEGSRFSESVTWLPIDDTEFEAFGSVLGEISPGIVVTDINLVGRLDEYLDLLYPGPVHVSLHEHNYPILGGDLVIAPTIRPLETGPGGTVGVTHFQGPDFILLSPEITALRAGLIPGKSEAETGFISMGGGDPGRLTHAVLNTLRAFNYPRIRWHVVLGPSSGYSPVKMAGAYPGMFEFIEGGTLDRREFLELMAGSEVVITNGGTTLYESLALKRPTMAIPQNDFEKDVIDELLKMGACTGVKKVNHQAILKTLEGFMESDGRREMAERAGDTIDGEGSSRVAKLILDRLK